MSFLKTFLALGLVGTLGLAAAPPAAADDDDRRGRRHWQDGRGDRGYHAERRWRGPPRHYGYYAPPPRVYYPPPRTYYAPPRYYYPPPLPPPGAGFYFRF